MALQGANDVLMVFWAGRHNCTGVIPMVLAHQTAKLLAGGSVSRVLACQPAATVPFGDLNSLQSVH